jgi:hypothetical protein
MRGNKLLVSISGGFPPAGHVCRSCRAWPREQGVQGPGVLSGSRARVRDSVSMTNKRHADLLESCGGGKRLWRRHRWRVASQHGLNVISTRIWCGGCPDSLAIRPSLPTSAHACQLYPRIMATRLGLTFLNVLRPARMLPPVHVVYMRSGGASILILMSFTASLCTSCNNLLPNPLVKVDPPESTMLP